MASGDTKTNQYLDIAANGTRADLPSDTCCETRSQTLIREVAERIMDVEDEVEELKNNPDVVDIVATYADLQAYDTQHLTDKDIIRVLQDETHDGESTYYRYNKQSDAWTYIGESKQYTDFVGTDGTTAGEAGLVPAPATTDAGKFLKADGTWDDAAGSTYTAGDGIDITNDVISATNTGKARVLTTADYNWPTTGTKTTVALWLLDSGLYTKASSNVNVNITTGTTMSGNTHIALVDNLHDDENHILAIGRENINLYRVSDAGTISSGFPKEVFFKNQIVNNLTTSTTGGALDAYQGKVLKDLVDSLAIRGTGAPTTSTVGTVGTLYEDTTNGDLYICTDATNPYVWAEVGAGGGGSGVIELTSADYNYHLSGTTDDGVAVWLLDEGFYTKANGVKLYKASNQTTSNATAFLTLKDSTFTHVILNDSSDTVLGVVNSQGQAITAYSSILTGNNITQSTGTSTTNVMSQKAVTDAIAAIPTGGGITELTSADYNHDSTGGSTFDEVALWLMPAGVYTAKNGVQVAARNQAFSRKTTGGIWIVGEYGVGTDNDHLPIMYIDGSSSTLAGSYLFMTNNSGGAVGGSPLVTPISQSTGTSTTDVMSQNAATSMIFADPATQYKIKIGAGTSTSEGNHAVEIGHSAAATSSAAVAMGYNASASSSSAIALGHGAQASAISAIALGRGAKATAKGELNIGTPLSSGDGYNSSNYRLLTGLYDPQGAHDAATKGYCDSAILNGGTTAPTTATVGAVGTLYSYVDTSGTTPVPHLMVCTVADTVTPSYTWVEAGAAAITNLTNTQMNNIWNGE